MRKANKNLYLVRTMSANVRQNASTKNADEKSGEAQCNAQTSSTNAADIDCRQ